MQSAGRRVVQTKRDEETKNTKKHSWTLCLHQGRRTQATIEPARRRGTALNNEVARRPRALNKPQTTSRQAGMFETGTPRGSDLTSESVHLGASQTEESNKPTAATKGPVAQADPWTGHSSLGIRIHGASEQLQFPSSAELLTGSPPGSKTCATRAVCAM